MQKPDGSYEQRPKQIKRIRLRKMDIQMATWNVRTMLQPGKMQEIVKEIMKYGLDLVAIQEIRWNGQGRLDKKEFSMFYSGPEKRTGLFGTGFIVNAKTRRSVIGFEPISDRICKLRLKGRFRNMTVISTHAPTEEADERKKEEFYDELTRTIDTVPGYDMILILGDFNAKIGQEEFIKQVAGSYSLHEETSDNGILLGQLAAANSLVIKSTCFDHKNIHKGTWQVPGSNSVNQIDHVLVAARHASSVIDVRSCRGPNCDSDHFLVKAVIRERLSNVQKRQLSERKRWNQESLNDSEKNRSFKSEISRRLQSANITNITDIEEKWEVIKSVIQESAQEIMGTMKKMRNEWFDEECAVALDMKNEARKRIIQRETRQGRAIYVELRREANKICRKKKKAMLTKKIEGIEEMSQQNAIRAFYRETNWFRKGYQPRLTGCKDKQGRLLDNETDIANRWKEHFQELLNIRSEEEYDLQPKIQSAEPHIEAPSLYDVQKAINQLRNHRAAGVDGITSEMLKNCGQEATNEICSLISKIWEEEKMPSQWNMGIIFPIYKKGDKLKCANYRGITLLNMAYKVLSNILLKKLEIFYEEIVGEYQCGFRKNRSTTDQIFVVRQAMQKCYEHNTDLHMLFIDYRQAFDSVCRSGLYEYMEKKGIPSKLIRLVKMTTENAKAQVMIEGKLGDVITLERGVRQGDALSAILFNLALNSILEKHAGTNNIVHKSTQLCAYADDVVLISRNINYLKEMLRELEEQGKRMGLEINEGKTKYMHVTTAEKRRNTNNLTIDSYTFENVVNFEYLGVLINNNNKVSQEIKRRIINGNKAYFVNLKLIKSRLLSRKTKIRIYKTLIRPVVTYGSEAWNLSASDCNKLRVFERKIVRRIYGAVLDRGEWRIRNNQEINEILKNEDIVRFIKSQRLRWLGHIERMIDTRAPKVMYKAKMERRRRPGRPRNRWADEVEADLKVMNVHSWRSAARDRCRWKSVVGEAKAHPEL